jgi:ribonuclease P protein component
VLLSAKLCKITKRAEYIGLFNNNSRVVGRYFIILYNNAHKENMNMLRYGITVSKKVGNAVIRNKNKRIVRVLIRNFHIEQVTINMCVNVIVRRFINGKNFYDIQRDFNSALKKVFAYEKYAIKNN